jgi:UPF0755 protein
VASSRQPRHGERSAADREAARAERERRRAARTGNVLLAEADSPGRQPPDPPTHPEPPTPTHPEQPTQAQAEPPTQGAPPVAQGESPKHDAPPVLQAESPTQAAPPVLQAESPTQAAPPVLQAESPTQAAPLVQPVQPERQDGSAVQDGEPLPQRQPTATRRRGGEDRHKRHGGRNGAGRRKGRGGRNGAGARPQGAHSMRARLGAVGALAGVALAAWAVVLLVQHLKGTGGASNVVSRPPVAKVVIPEGETRGQIAAIARKDGLQGDYLRASVHNSGLEPRRFGAPAGTPNLEGFLFPATYELPVHGGVTRLVAEQLEAFQERVGPQEARDARALHLSVYQMLIVASMVEREALLPHDRPLVAAVIYNRLRLGMPLGIDATIRFALKDWEKPLTETQLQTPSPYNTRLHKGLPPTPISNPGVESIEAAAHPAHAGYLYYVDAADGCGELVFSDTFAEFERDSAAYQEALRAHGGHVPACRHR